MTDNAKNNYYYWINLFVVVPGLLLSGAIMAALYLTVPVVFTLGVTAFVFKFCLGMWTWRSLPPEERRKFREPFRLMNYNYTLSVKMEWFLFWIGFLAFLFWIEHSQATS